MGPDLVRPACDQMNPQTGNGTGRDCLVFSCDGNCTNPGLVADKDPGGFFVFGEKSPAHSLGRLWLSLDETDIALIQCALFEYIGQYPGGFLRFGEKKQAACLVVQPMTGNRQLPALGCLLYIPRCLLRDRHTAGIVFFY
jgi:hypothetical protein